MSEQKTLNPWDYKPWWCQPWSILLTGVTLIVGSWLLLKIIWVTVIVAIPVLTWMGFFFAGLAATDDSQWDIGILSK